MKLNISLSSSFGKGDRVAVEVDKNEWYSGTVIGEVAKGYRVKFDDDEKVTIDPDTDRMYKIDLPRPRKSPMTTAQMREVRVTSRAPRTTSTKIKLDGEPPRRARTSASPRSRSERTTGGPVPHVVPLPKGRKTKPQEPKTLGRPLITSLTGAGVKAPPTKTVDTPVKRAIDLEPDVDEKMTNEERHLQNTLGLPPKFKTATFSGKVGQLRYLGEIWKEANTKFFDNQLRPCNIRIMKDMGTRFMRRGQWAPGKREIGMSPRLFKGKEYHVLTTMVHEMCHQAVSEIDYVRDDGNAGHGPHWTKWMTHCGLTPSRYSKYDNENFMTDEERDAHNRVKGNMQAARDTHKRIYNPRPMQPAQWLDPKTNKWHKGLIVGLHDLQAKRWVFISQPRTDSWKIIPTDYLYELPHEEHEQFLTPAFKEAAEHIMAYKDLMREGKRRARNDKTRMRGGLL